MDHENIETIEIQQLPRREEMNIITCEWDGNSETQTCWLGEKPGTG